MSGEVEVVRANDPKHAELLAAGWVLVARSWGAELDSAHADRDKLTDLAALASTLGSVRELGAEDVDAILELDAATAGDYPGSIATRHDRLDRSRATPSATRAAWGFHVLDGSLAAVTFIDIDDDRAEIDFTVVARAWRGQGVGMALKASSLLVLLHRGVRNIRTGGSAENAAIIAAITALGFVIDEHWVTLEQTARDLRQL